MANGTELVVRNFIKHSKTDYDPGRNLSTQNVQQFSTNYFFMNASG